MIPLGHDFTDERVLVFGGGPVGARKARTFAREARTVVVSPAFADRSFGDAHRVRAAPDPEAVADWIDRVAPALVVAATDDERVNAAAAHAASEAGALVNRADRSASDTASDESDAGTESDAATEDDATADDSPDTSAGSPTEHRVTTLATIRDDPVVVAVGTGGTAPALSRELRRRIEPVVNGAGAMAALLGELRPEAKRRADPADRRAAMRAVAASAAVWKGLRRGATNAREEARRLLEEHV